MTLLQQPLDGLRVIDFSTLLPGPLASLVLAEAGAEVTKIEQPGGDALRDYPPTAGSGAHPMGAGFALLNRGKRSIEIDLKDSAQRARLLPLIAQADVLIEQFRPGVMARLGLDYETLRHSNPKLVYCSITGYGQSGPKAQRPGHDLNYLAESGLLSLTAGKDGAPVIPPGLIADIGGGALPAVINILLALRAAQATGAGCHLDVAMSDGLFAWLWWALGQQAATEQAPAPGGELLSGGSPRYQLYRTDGGGYLAVAALEQKFWDRFCELIYLAPRHRREQDGAAAAIDAVARIVAQRPADHWQELFEGEEVCCSIVRDLDSALVDPQVAARDLFAGGVTVDGRRLPALPLPLAPIYRRHGDEAAPALGRHNDLLE